VLNGKFIGKIILGCSFEDFKIYLESKFEIWMNWGNYGLYNGELGYGWDIDHIIPISFAETEEDVIRLNHFTNLQPLCSKINRDIKSNFLFD
jgi:HNH endonuclease